MPRFAPRGALFWTLLLASTLLWMGLLAGCDSPSDVDAGSDATTPDAGTDAGRRDAAAPMCTPECGVGESCCPTSGENACVALRSDPEHCGRCEVNCIAENRGFGCEFSTCTCGGSRLGCTGTRESFCCPARTAGSSPYCANLELGASDCGSCGTTCNPLEADRCEGGVCRCGTGRDACAGTPESRCCQVGVDIACVDTTTDNFHCGTCDNLCRAGERCEGGTCTDGPTCPGGCDVGAVCCGGTCCSRRACLGGVCTAGDGGTPDAGIDAG